MTTTESTVKRAEPVVCDTLLPKLMSGEVRVRDSTIHQEIAP